MVAAVPFAEALAPWLTAAERRLAAAAPGLDRVLTSAARASLVGGLGRELACVTSPTLLDRFLEYPDRRRFTPHSTVAHDRFVRHLAAGGLDAVLAELPELARLVGHVVDGWCERVGRLAARLEGDRALLEARFSARLPFDAAVPVVDTAVALGGAGGMRVVYKDRPLGMDAAFAALLRWVNAASAGRGGACRDLLVPRVVDRGEFGWMSFVPEQPAEEPAARRAALTRTGMLVCLVHALGGGDVHRDNVRVVGAHPVIIDAEVLLRPRRASAAGGDAETPSALATGWVPTVLEVERCGLASGARGERSQRWVDVGTDAIRQRPLRSPLAGARPDVMAWFRREWPRSVAHVCAGFRAMYALIAERGLPLDAFAGSRPRVLLRTSYLYQETIERSLHPAVLASSAARAAAIEPLVRRPAPAVRHHAAVAAAVAAAERRSMDALQVPRFGMRADGRELRWRDQVLGEPFPCSPLQRAHRLVAAMCPSAMEAQCRDIADALGAAAHGTLDAAAVRLEPLPRLALEAP